MIAHARSLPAPPAGLLSQIGPRPARQMASPEPPVAAQRGAGSAVLGVLLCLGMGMVAIAHRERIAAIVPQTTPIFAAIGLPIADLGLSLGEVETTLGDEGSTKVLTLQAHITNRQKTGATVPNLRIVVRDDSAQILYTWTAPSPRAQLGPGEVVDFRSRLVSPPLNGHDVVVSFADRSADVTGTPDRR